MRKKLAIVSSYNTVCGNASYTHVLKEALSLHFDTDIVAINHKLLGNAHPAARGLRETYLTEVAARLKNYDCVNIQYEAALYGYSQASAVQNVARLIQASRSLLFTIHRVPNPSLQDPLWKTIIRNGKKFWRTLQVLNTSRNNHVFNDLIRVLKEHQGSGHKVTALVHTPRERELLDIYFGFKDVIDFPITFLNKEQIAACASNRESIRKKVFDKYTFDPASKYIGIFGFLSENKGHHIAINTLKFLPSNYKLAIFGAQHPMSIQEYNLGAFLKNPVLFQKNNNAYISSLIDLSEDVLAQENRGSGTFTPDQHRVRFLGSLSDEDFIEAMTAMDFIIVPYFETGQGGSGNASIALEVGAKVLFSRTFAFMDLAHYYPDCFEIADIGNACEMAQRIYTWKKDVTSAQKHAVARFCIENNALIHKEALENGPLKAQELKKALYE